MTLMLALSHIPKTAGTTLIHMLRRSFGRRHCEARKFSDGSPHSGVFDLEDLHRARWVYPHLTSIAGHVISPCSNLDIAIPDIWYFTFFREPLARCASHYQHHIRVGHISMSFEEWIQDDIYRNYQTRHIAGLEDVDKAIKYLNERVAFVGIVERFDDSLVMLKRCCPERALNIHYSAKNVAHGFRIKNDLLCCAKSRRLLEEANQQDIQLYNYVKEELFEKQIVDYGPSLRSDVTAFQESNHPARFYRGQIPGMVARHLVYRPLIRMLRFSNSFTSRYASHTQ